MFLESENEKMSDYYIYVKLNLALEKFHGLGYRKKKIKKNSQEMSLSSTSLVLK